MQAYKTPFKSASILLKKDSGYYWARGVSLSSESTYFSRLSKTVSLNAESFKTKKSTAKAACAISSFLILIIRFPNLNLIKSFVLFLLSVQYSISILSLLKSWDEDSSDKLLEFFDFWKYYDFLFSSWYLWFWGYVPSESLLTWENWIYSWLIFTTLYDSDWIAWTILFIGYWF